MQNVRNWCSVSTFPPSNHLSLPEAWPNRCIYPFPLAPVKLRFCTLCWKFQRSFFLHTWVFRLKYCQKYEYHKIQHFQTRDYFEETISQCLVCPCQFYKYNCASVYNLLCWERSVRFTVMQAEPSPLKILLMHFFHSHSQISCSLSSYFTLNKVAL